MLKIVAIMLCGIAVGVLLRRRKARFLPHVITVLIWVLLFILGIEVGGNERVVRGLHTLGIEATVISLAGLAGSVLMAWLLWRVVLKREDAKAEGGKR